MATYLGPYASAMGKDASFHRRALDMPDEDRAGKRYQEILQLLEEAKARRNQQQSPTETFPGDSVPSPEYSMQQPAYSPVMEQPQDAASGGMLGPYATRQQSATSDMSGFEKFLSSPYTSMATKMAPLSKYIMPAASSAATGLTNLGNSLTNGQPVSRAVFPIDEGMADLSYPSLTNAGLGAVGGMLGNMLTPDSPVGGMMGSQLGGQAPAIYKSMAGGLSEGAGNLLEGLGAAQGLTTMMGAGQDWTNPISPYLSSIPLAGPILGGFAEGIWGKSGVSDLDLSMEQIYNPMWQQSLQRFQSIKDANPGVSDEDLLNILSGEGLSPIYEYHGRHGRSVGELATALGGQDEPATFGLFNSPWIGNALTPGERIIYDAFQHPTELSAHRNMGISTMLEYAKNTEGGGELNPSDWYYEMAMQGLQPDSEQG